MLLDERNAAATGAQKNYFTKKLITKKHRER